MLDLNFILFVSRNHHKSAKYSIFTCHFSPARWPAIDQNGSSLGRVKRVWKWSLYVNAQRDHLLASYEAFTDIQGTYRLLHFPLRKMIIADSAEHLHFGESLSCLNVNFTASNVNITINDFPIRMKCGRIFKYLLHFNTEFFAYSLIIIYSVTVQTSCLN